MTDSADAAPEPSPYPPYGMPVEPPRGSGWRSRGRGPTPTTLPGTGGARNSLGVAALVCGVLGLLLSWTVVLGIPLGALGVGLGIRGRQRAGRGAATNVRQATTGLATGAVGLAVSLALLVTAIVLLSQHRGDLDAFRRCVHVATDRQQIDSCSQTLQQALTH